MSTPCARITVGTGDITQQHVAAIVNAANTSLLGGGGVDGAIHRAAGPRLLEFNRKLGGCPTGDARITPSFNLEKRGITHIIHTVGPVWHGDAGTPLGDCREDVLLASCYRTSLTLAAENKIATVAFPAISTGVYRFPIQRAARIAVAQVRTWLADHDHPEQVVFCCYSDADAAVYRQVLDDTDQGRQA